jgi:hypothetical protein
MLSLVRENTTVNYLFFAIDFIVTGKNGKMIAQVRVKR